MLDQDVAQRTISPGDHLRSEMKRLGFDQRALAQAVDFSRQTINYVINGKKEITPDLGAALAEVMGLPKTYWLQGEYLDLPSDQQAVWPSLASKYGPGVLVDTEIEQAVSAGDIDISPFNPMNVRQASIDLTVGEKLVLADGEVVKLSAQEGYFIEEGETVFLISAERISLNNQMVGRVGGTTNYVRQGLAVFHGFQIDPGFNGQMQYMVRNLGGAPVEIIAGQQFLSIEFSALARNPRQDFDSRGYSILETISGLRGRAGVDQLYDVLAPFLKAKIIVTAKGDYFSAAIPGLHDAKATYATEREAKEGFFEEIRRLLTHHTLGGAPQGISDFLPSLKRFVEDRQLTRQEVTEVIRGLKFDVQDDGTILNEKNETVFCTLPAGNGRVRLSEVLSELDSFGVIDWGGS